MKASSGIVVATLFLDLTVHRRIAGNVPDYLKFALKVTHRFRKRRFQQISLNSAASVKASEKSSIIADIGSRQCAFYRAIDEPCALPLVTTRGNVLFTEDHQLLWEFATPYPYRGFVSAAGTDVPQTPLRTPLTNR